MLESSERELAVFSDARKLPARERGGFLDRACAGDAGLRQRIEELLQAGEEAGDFLAGPAARPPSRGGPLRPMVPLSEKAGDWIGRYKLVEVIGEGGCGVVYRAEQEEPVRRQMALKVIKLGMDTKSVIARFEAERQALALMDHPNIAKVLDAGATVAGRPYFVMELVRGSKITDYCDQHSHATRERLDLFMQVCRAVQHAHQKGIIHRDLKPSNILVTMNDGVAVPKVIDFGIAKATQGKLTDHTVFTAFEQLLGTPAYMSPEQAELSAVDIDTRSDIYALGVLLYELLTGQTPFDARKLLQAGLDEIRRTIREVEPARPSTRLSTLTGVDLAEIAKCRSVEPPKLIHLVQGDLDWIVMKCLEKDRARRYDTATGLAADVQRQLKHEPVVARPPGWAYLVRKFMLRHRLALVAASIVAGTGILGVAGIFWQWRQAEWNARDAISQRRIAEQETAETRLNLYAADISVAAQALQNGYPALARRTLAALRPAPGATDLRGFEWYYLWHHTTGDQLAVLKGHHLTVNCAAFSPDGQRLATGSFDGTVRIWNADQRTFVTSLAVTTHAVWSVAFTPDGRQLMTGCNEHVDFWDTRTWQRTVRFPGELAALSATGTLLATVESRPFAEVPTGPVRLFDWRSGRQLGTLPGTGRAVALSHDGRLLAVAGTDSGITLYDTTTGHALRVWPTPEPLWSMDFSPDGRRLLATGYRADVSLWNVDQPGPPARLAGHAFRVWSAVFSADGTTIASTSSDQTIRLWDAATLTTKYILHGHSSEVWCAAFNPAGTLLATGGKDRNVMLWPTTPVEPPTELPHDSDFRPLFSPDGRWLVTVNPQVEQWRLWQVADHSLICSNLANGHYVFGFSQDGKCVAAFGTNHTTLQFWRPNGTRPEREIVLAGTTPNPREFEFMGMSPDMEFAFTIDGTGLIRIWTTDSGRLVNTIQGPVPPIRNAVMSRRGRQLAVSVESENQAHLYDCATGADHPLAGHTDFVSGLAFTPDGAMLATGSVDGTIRLWQTTDGTVLATLPGHLMETTDVAISPDGRTLASLGKGESLKLWHLSTLREVDSESLPHAGLFLRFSPDGRTLAVQTDADKLRLLTAPAE